MKEKYLNTTIAWITKYKNYSNEEIEELRYGLEGLYLTFTKLIIICLLAIMLGVTKELVLLLIFFNIIRFTGFGFHARTSFECLICSTLLFVFLPILMSYLHLNKVLLVVVGLICLLVLSIYAPADTIKRPLPNKKKRKIRKLSTIFIALIYILLSWFVKDYDLSYLLITSLILESIMVSPLIYKLFKQPYRNYLNYNKA